jgi:hypothetical protein
MTAENVVRSRPSLRAKRSNPYFLFAAAMDCFASLAMTAPQFQIHVRDLAARCARVVHLSLALFGGRGECRVPTAPAASCALCIGRKHTSNNEYTGTPGIPARNGFLHRGLDWANHIDPVQQIRPCARAAWAGWPTGFALMRAQHVTEGA